MDVKLHCELLGISVEEYQEKLATHEEWEKNERKAKEAKLTEIADFDKTHGFSCRDKQHCIHQNVVWNAGIHCGSCEALAVWPKEEE
jgi:hypothetical protein